VIVLSALAFLLREQTLKMRLPESPGGFRDPGHGMAQTRFPSDRLPRGKRMVSPTDRETSNSRPSRTLVVECLQRFPCLASLTVHA
jgi:hypothetical protein